MNCEADSPTSLGDACTGGERSELAIFSCAAGDSGSARSDPQRPSRDRRRQRPSPSPSRRARLASASFWKQPHAGGGERIDVVGVDDFLSIDEIDAFRAERRGNDGARMTGRLDDLDARTGAEKYRAADDSRLTICRLDVLDEASERHTRIGASGRLQCLARTTHDVEPRVGHTRANLRPHFVDEQLRGRARSRGSGRFPRT